MPKPRHPNSTHTRNDLSHGSVRNASVVEAFPRDPRKRPTPNHVAANSSKDNGLGTTVYLSALHSDSALAEATHQELDQMYAAVERCPLDGQDVQHRKTSYPEALAQCVGALMRDARLQRDECHRQKVHKAELRRRRLAYRCPPSLLGETISRAVARHPKTTPSSAIPSCDCRSNRRSGVSMPVIVRYPSRRHSCTVKRPTRVSTEARGNSAPNPQRMLPRPLLNRESASLSPLSEELRSTAIRLPPRPLSKPFDEDAAVQHPNSCGCDAFRGTFRGAVNLSASSSAVGGAEVDGPTPFQLALMADIYGRRLRLRSALRRWRTQCQGLIAFRHWRRLTLSQQLHRWERRAWRRKAFRFHARERVRRLLRRWQRALHKQNDVARASLQFVRWLASRSLLRWVARWRLRWRREPCQLPRARLHVKHRNGGGGSSINEQLGSVIVQDIGAVRSRTLMRQGWNLWRLRYLRQELL